MHKLKITDMIKVLQSVLDYHGDLHVMALDANGQERFDIEPLVTNGARNEYGKFVGEDVLIITSGPQM